MQIHLKASELELTPSLRTYAETKLGALAKLISKAERTAEPELVVEIGRTTRHHHRGPVFRAEGNLRMPGRMIRAEHVDLDLRVAIDRLRDKLHLEIEKFKTKNSRRPQTRK